LVNQVSFNVCVAVVLFKLRNGYKHGVTILPMYVSVYFSISRTVNIICDLLRTSPPNRWKYCVCYP